MIGFTCVLVFTLLLDRFQQPSDVRFLEYCVRCLWEGIFFIIYYVNNALKKGLRSFLVIFLLNWQLAIGAVAEKYQVESVYFVAFTIVKPRYMRMPSTTWSLSLSLSGIHNEWDRGINKGLQEQKGAKKKLVLLFLHEFGELDDSDDELIAWDSKAPCSMYVTISSPRLKVTLMVRYGKYSNGVINHR